MTYRELPPSEWEKLEGHEGFAGLPMPDPAHAWITVAEDESGTICGFHVAQAVVHTEPIWVDPKFRSSRVAAMLFNRTRQILDTRNIPEAYCFAASSTTAEYLERLGAELLPYLIFKLCPASSDSDDLKKKRSPNKNKTPL